MSDAPLDKTAAGTAEENIPTQSNPMDNIHGNVEDISNKASGYKVMRFFPPPSFFFPFWFSPSFLASSTTLTPLPFPRVLEEAYNGSLTLARTRA